MGGTSVGPLDRPVVETMGISRLGTLQKLVPYPFPSVSQDLSLVRRHICDHIWYSLPLSADSRNILDIHIRNHKSVKKLYSRQ
jgi:hypothetical protein